MTHPLSVSCFVARRFRALAPCLVLLAACSSDSLAPKVATRLSFAAAPGSAVAGVAFLTQPSVVVLRSDGTVDSTSTAIVTLSVGQATVTDTLRGTVVARAASGVATFSGLALDRATAGVTLVASASGLAGAESPSFAVQPGAPTAVAFTQFPDSAVAGVTLSPVPIVAVLDVRGNRVTQATGAVSLQVSTGPAGATINGTTTASIANGLATFPGISLPKAGVGYTLSGTLVGVAGVSSQVSKVIKVAPAAATGLEFLQQPTATVIGSPFVPAVQVRLVDAFGNTVPSAAPVITLALTTNAAGALLQGTPAVAPVLGVATFGDLKLDKAGTSFRMTATAPGVSSVTSTLFSVGVGVQAGSAAGRP